MPLLTGAGSDESVADLHRQLGFIGDDDADAQCDGAFDIWRLIDRPDVDVETQLAGQDHIRLAQCREVRMHGLQALRVSSSQGVTQFRSLDRPPNGTCSLCISEERHSSKENDEISVLFDQPPRPGCRALDGERTRRIWTALSASSNLQLDVDADFGERDHGLLQGGDVPRSLERGVDAISRPMTTGSWLTTR